MRRREFITLLGGAAASWPRMAWAQQAGKTHRIGWLQPGPIPDQWVKGFRQGLQEFNYIEGKNLIIDYRWGDGSLDQLPAMAKELVDLSPDVIVSINSVALLALQSATTTIPIVMLGTADPAKALGLEVPMSIFIGVGVAVAGERADLGLVEDPFARWEDAQSATVQEEAWEWYTGDFVPRLKPNAKRVIITTRFNEFDLLGRVFERDAALGIKWRVIRLPMIAEDDDPLGRQRGERLWPEWFTEEQVIEARSDAQKWAALYQQSPSPETGNYFHADWLRPYSTIPDRATLRVYGASDYAVTADGGDYTVHVVIGVDPEGHMYLLDLWRARASSDVWIDALCDLVLKWKPIGWAEEQGQIRAGIGPFLDRRSRERKAYFAREQFPTRGDKAVRAQSVRGKMAMDGLYVPSHAPWYPDFRAELLSFPAGKHDDQVDAIGLFGQLLDKVLAGQKPKPPPEPEKHDDYQVAINDDYGSFLTM